MTMAVLSAAEAAPTHSRPMPRWLDFASRHVLTLAAATTHHLSLRADRRDGGAELQPHRGPVRFRLARFLARGLGASVRGAGTGRRADDQPAARPRRRLHRDGDRHDDRLCPDPLSFLRQESAGAGAAADHLHAGGDHGLVAPQPLRRCRPADGAADAGAVACHVRHRLRRDHGEVAPADLRHESGAGGDGSGRARLARLPQDHAADHPALGGHRRALSPSCCRSTISSSACSCRATP